MARSRDASLSDRPITTFFDTLFDWTSRGSWNTTVRASGTQASPPSGASSPARMRSKVVLPLPDAPSSATNSPLWIVRLRLSRTVFPVKLRLTSPTSTATGRCEKSGAATRSAAAKSIERTAVIEMSPIGWRHPRATA